MALHQSLQRLLLVGARLPLPPPAPDVPAPPALQRLIDANAAAHRQFDERAIHFGHRYRSGFWAIYLLSALAVLCAVLPLALGWDSPRHMLHPYAGAWAVAEVGVILTVSAIYWLGHRHDWQGQWMYARTTAELSWYMPVIAPLLDWSAPVVEANWYLRLFEPGQHLQGANDISKLCARSEPLARQLLAGAWSDPAFIAGYARWASNIFEQQRIYHQVVAMRQHALMHRVHRINFVLFTLTACGALTHLMVHTLWLSLVTTFFPALGASLHGALAQSESYRLEAASERLVGEIGSAQEQIQATLDASGVAHDVPALQAAIKATVGLLLEEHQDWMLLVRPHSLPLG